MSNEFIDDNIRGNRIQSVVLIFAMVCVVSLIGFFLGNAIGLVIAVVVCIGLVFFAPRVSPHLVLKMYKAQPISRQQAPALMDLFAELVRRADLPTSPRLYYVPSRTLNAFAVGYQSDSAVAVTDGLLRIMTPREIAGVLAHEVSHIRHRDMRVLGIADSVSRITGTLAQIGQFMLLFAVPAYLLNGGWLLLVGAVGLMIAPFASNLLQLALSRAREFNADLGAVQLTRDAKGLASALSKLERIMTGGATRPWIFAGKRKQTVPAMLRTHPKTDERVRRILEAGESMAGESMAGESMAGESMAGESMAGESMAAGQPRLPSTENTRRRERLAPQEYPRVRRGPSWHMAGLWY